MNFHYSAERNVQMVLYLLKAYNIKRVIASPGATNVAIVSSMQQDPFFEMYSCVDERSAAYMAVGIADETGDPVVLTCTGATSSRNYMPALTEAYYRKLPIIAITSSQDLANVGHLIAQVTDRTAYPNDVFVDFAQIQNIMCSKDEWDCNIKLNKVIQNYRVNPGPVHINLATLGLCKNDVVELPETKVIRLYLRGDSFPEISHNGHVAIFIGSHQDFSSQEIEAIDKFCQVYNAVAFCDHTSSYHGKYRIMHALIGAQDKKDFDISYIDTLIHLGEVSGDYDTLRYLKPKRVWRVNPDGFFRDTFQGKLDKVFAMPELLFFDSYTKNRSVLPTTYYEDCKIIYNDILKQIPTLPLSNIFVARVLSSIIPNNSVLYLGILNTLRSWNFFNIDNSIKTVSNVGGFGIDGILSSMIGASLCNPNRLHFGIVGDLSFFYDMNCLCNRQIGNNVRILVINNGHGQEFEMYNHGAAFMGTDVNEYVAAQGHNGNKSRDLIKHYSSDLGFKYLVSEKIDDIHECAKDFVSEYSEKPIVWEIFTTNSEENEALRTIRNLVPGDISTTQKVKNLFKSITGA